jgi:hypothetical protein
VTYGSAAPFYAFILAVVAGTLLGTHGYLGGAITALLAVVIYGLHRFARDRGDDDSHTIW